MDHKVCGKEVPHKQVLQLLDIILPIGGELEVQAGAFTQSRSTDVPSSQGLGIVLNGLYYKEMHSLLLII